MGTRLTIGTRISVAGYDYNVDDYTVTESGSPLAITDSSGGVGEMSFSLPLPDPYHDRARSDDPLRVFGPMWLIDQPVTILDSRNGLTLGQITSISISQDSTGVSVSGYTRLDILNAYNVQAGPFVGTLGGLAGYYFGLVGITTDWQVDASIASRAVAVPGWTGELWYYLKQLMAAQGCEIALVSGVILIRPLRTRIAERNRAVSLSNGVGAGSLAQSVEVYWYRSEEITDELVYPPGGWTPETPVLNVNAGETAEYTLELSSSVSSIQAPTHETYVSDDYEASSVYTVVADDGFVVSEAQWSDQGGSVTITVNPDTKTLKVVLVGANEVPVATGGYSKAFSLALASDTSGSRYSTLRIVGTGVRYVREKKVFRTGVPASKTATEVGVTIDNPFINDLNTAYNAGVRAASQFSGTQLTLSGTVTAINRRGDSGVADYPTYAEVQEALEAELGTPSYSDVQTWYTGSGYTSYALVLDYWFDLVASMFENQTFGNVGGARIFDPLTGRYYRIRQATVTPTTITIQSADDDLTFEDVQNHRAGKTYADVQAERNAMTYTQDRLAVYSA